MKRKKTRDGANKIVVSGDTAKIHLNRRKVCVIDAEDLPIVLGRKWSARKMLQNWYCAHNFKRPDGSWSTIYLHRAISKTPLGMGTDHKDGNGLNNTKKNLRHCNQSQNNCNSRKRKNTSSRYKGVTWDKSRKSWTAYIAINGKRISIGRFHNELLAGKAYNKAAKKYHGDFASPNVI